MRVLTQITSPVARLAFTVAALSALTNLGTYFGLAMTGRFEALAALHLATIALGVVLFLRIWVHHRLSWQMPSAIIARQSVPRWLFWSAATSLVYLIIMVISATRYGAGFPEVRNGGEFWVRPDSSVVELPPGAVRSYASELLRVFSAGWLSVTLMISAASDVLENRISELRSWRRQTAAAFKPLLQAPHTLDGLLPCCCATAASIDMRRSRTARR